MTNKMGDNISEVLGNIKNLSIRLQKFGYLKDFESIASFLTDDIKRWISVSIPSILYKLYKKDNRWIVFFEWSLIEHLPIINSSNELPLSFQIAKDGDSKLLALLVKYKYDINERFLTHTENKSEYISIYNVIQDKADVQIIFNGGWRPICTNKGTDLAYIILNKQLKKDSILKILSTYFMYDDPNRCLLEDNSEVLDKIDLLSYLVKNWTNQDIEILNFLLSDPRWEYDTIFYARLRTNTLVTYLDDKLKTHDNRPILFKDKIYIWDYIFTLMERNQTAYTYIMTTICDSTEVNSHCHLVKFINDTDKYKVTSDEAYTFMNNVWVGCIANYLPYDISPNILYNPIFAMKVCSYLEHWGRCKNKEMVLNCFDVHNVLKVQINFISWIHENYWFSSIWLRNMYLNILKNILYN